MRRAFCKLLFACTLVSVPTYAADTTSAPSGDALSRLAWAMRDIPTGTAYAVWVGIGAALTVIWAMVTGETDVSWAKLALIAGLVGCVVGLKLVDGAGH